MAESKAKHADEDWFLAMCGAATPFGRVFTSPLKAEYSWRWWYWPLIYGLGLAALPIATVALALCVMLFRWMTGI